MDVIAFSNQSRKTEENNLIVQKSLVDFFGDTSIESLNYKGVRDWKLQLDKGRSDATVRGYIISLRVVLRHCRRIGLAVIDPESIPVPKRTQKVPIFISPIEVEEFISFASKPARGYSSLNRLRNQAMISLLYASGIRAHELCKLDRDSIRERTFTIIGKGSKARLCFIDERTEMLLNNYLDARSDGHPAMFIANQTGSRITTGNLQRVFLNLSKKMGLKQPIHPHVMRHSFATNLLKNNTNMRYVQMLLGHSSLQTTQMYTHVVDRDLEKVYKKFHTI